LFWATLLFLWPFLCAFWWVVNVFVAWRYEEKPTRVNTGLVGRCDHKHKERAWLSTGARAAIAPFTTLVGAVVAFAKFPARNFPLAFGFALGSPTAEATANRLLGGGTGAWLAMIPLTDAARNHSINDALFLHNAQANFI
jgi:hypothetical protein